MDASSIPLRVAVHSTDSRANQTVAHAREILAALQQSIKTGRKIEIFEVSSEGDSLPLQYDAILLCDDGSAHAYGPWSDLAREEDNGITSLDVCCPSSLLSSRSSEAHLKFIDDIQIRIVAIPPEAASTETSVAIQPIKWAGSYASQRDPCAPVYVVRGATDWADSVLNSFRTEFDDIKTTVVTHDFAVKALLSQPQMLNGIVLASPQVSELLFETVLSSLPSRNLATFVRVPQEPDRPSVYLVAGRAPDQHDGLASPTGIARSIIAMLEDNPGFQLQSNALAKAFRRTIDPPELIGSNMRPADLGGTATHAQFVEMVCENLKYLAKASVLSTRHFCDDSATPPCNRHPRPLNVVEKIMLNARIGQGSAEMRPGNVTCVRVDWTLTNELLWAGMEKTFELMGRPSPYRNDRIWFAVDHTVDPRTIHLPRQKELIRKAEAFQREAKIVDFLPANTSIMHTDFTRDRAQPGTIVVGSDSHTCSAGSIGAFAIGLGAADVVMPLVTGETWLRVPEVCRINFVGSLNFGVGGKDVILHILGRFGRNTIAFQRAVEYGGPGLSQLSMDARFAIANMTTEFGGMGACFEADSQTAEWISTRPDPDHRHGGWYSRPDPGAGYAEERTVDLSAVRCTVALFPNPDDVVPITEQIGRSLDGCFIGACTTTEEDLIMGGLVLQAGLEAGKVPVKRGKRRVTPGSLLITRNLERRGLLKIYEQAGFEVGAPGCSYCVGINDVDVAAQGEVWLSSQNRNFRNRMGKGSIGNITTAAAVAASSFDMAVTDPADLLTVVDAAMCRNFSRVRGKPSLEIEVSEPQWTWSEPASATASAAGVASLLDAKSLPTHATSLVRSRAQIFGDNVDTDAVIPAEFMPGVDDADLGTHCFQYYRPEFRDKVISGSRIIVAGHGFGSGSSREDAVRALIGAGIEAVIAKSFAFIFERNQFNMGLFNLTIVDPAFFDNIDEDSIIVIDKISQNVTIEGTNRKFTYQHSAIETTLLNAGGVLPLYQAYDKDLFQCLVERIKAMRLEQISKEKGGEQNLSQKFEW